MTQEVEPIEKPSKESAPKETRWERALWLVLDKLVLTGVCVGLFVFLVGREAEHYKAREALAVEVAKQRVKAVTDLWEKILVLEDRRTTLIYKAIIHADTIGTDHVVQEVDPADIRAEGQVSRDMEIALEANHVWLDAATYGAFRDYISYSSKEASETSQWLTQNKRETSMDELRQRRQKIVEIIQALHFQLP